MSKLFLRKFFTLGTCLFNILGSTLLDSPQFLKLNGIWYQNADTNSNYAWKTNTYEVQNPLEAQYFYTIFSNRDMVTDFLNAVIHPDASISTVENTSYYTNEPGKPLIYQYTFNGKTIELVLSVTENYESRMQRFYNRINERKNPKTPIKYVTFYKGTGLQTNGKNISVFSSGLDLKTTSISKIDDVLDEIIINVPEIAKINASSKIKIGQSSKFLDSDGLQWLKFLTIASFQTPVNGKYIISQNNLNESIGSACKSIKNAIDQVTWSDEMFPASYSLISDIHDYVVPKNSDGKTLVESVKEATKSILTNATTTIPGVQKIYDACTDINEEIIAIKNTLEKLEECHANLTETGSKVSDMVTDISGEIKSEILKENTKKSTKILTNTTFMKETLENIDAALRDPNSTPTTGGGSTSGTTGEETGGDSSTSNKESTSTGEEDEDTKTTETRAETVYEILTSMHERITDIRQSINELSERLPRSEAIGENYAAIGTKIGEISASHNNISDKASSINDTLNVIKTSLGSLNSLLNNDSSIQESLNSIEKSVSNLSSKNSPFMNKINLILETAKFKDEYIPETTPETEIHEAIQNLPFHIRNSASYCDKVLINNPQLVFYLAAKILAAPTNIGETNDEFQAMTTNTGRESTSENYIYRNRIAIFYEAFKNDIFNAVIKNFCDHFEGKQKPNSNEGIETLLAKEFKDMLIHAFVSACGIDKTSTILPEDNPTVQAAKYIVRKYLDNLFDKKFTYNTNTTEEKWDSESAIIANLKARSYDNEANAIEGTGDTQKLAELALKYENILKNSPYLIFELWARYATAKIYPRPNGSTYYTEKFTMQSQLMIPGNTVRANKHILMNRLIVFKDAFKDFWFENANYNSVNATNIAAFQYWVEEILETEHKPQYINLFKNQEIIALNVNTYYSNTKYHYGLLQNFPD